MRKLILILFLLLISNAVLYSQDNKANELCHIVYKYCIQKDYINAVASCIESINFDNKPYPYYLIGSCYSDCQAYNEAIAYFDQALAVDPNYTNATNARKSARQLLVLNAISQTVNVISQTAITLSSTINTTNTSMNSNNSSNISHSSTPVGSASNSKINTYLNEQADKGVNRLKQNSKDRYDMYMRLYREAKSEAESSFHAYEMSKDVSDLIKSNDYQAQADEYLEYADIWK